MRCDLKGFLGQVSKESLKIASHVAIPNNVEFLDWFAAVLVFPSRLRLC